MNAMEATNALITENDYVELKRDIGQWPAGTRGTAVSDHGASKLIEISDDHGYELDMFEVAEEDLKLIKQYPCEVIEATSG